jgi:hypothetical protein
MRRGHLQQIGEFHLRCGRHRVIVGRDDRSRDGRDVTHPRARIPTREFPRRTGDGRSV